MSGAASLDMSLDDLIKSNKKYGGGGGGNFRGRGRSSSGPGPARRFPNRGGYRATPYGGVKAPETPWRHDMFNADQAVPYSGQGGGGRNSSLETGTKLYISNLEYSVSNEDIKELFSEVGDLKRHSIHYDRSGRSKGTAEVVFARRNDALAAVKRYNDVQLDGKPMKIEIVGANIANPAVLPPPSGSFGNFNGAPRSGQGRGFAPGRARGGGSGGRASFGRGRGRGRGGRGSGEKVVSAEDLDADLDKYHSAAMETN